MGNSQGYKSRNSITLAVTACDKKKTPSDPTEDRFRVSCFKRDFTGRLRIWNYELFGRMRTRSWPKIPVCDGRDGRPNLELHIGLSYLAFPILCLEVKSDKSCLHFSNLASHQTSHHFHVSQFHNSHSHSQWEREKNRTGTHDIDDTREVRISLEVSRFLESNLNGVGSDSHFDWKCPGIGLPFLRNRLTYSLNGIPWSCLCSDSYLPRIAPELELRFWRSGSPLISCFYQAVLTRQIETKHCSSCFSCPTGNLPKGWHFGRKAAG